jgi:hypothetical protein
MIDEPRRRSGRKDALTAPGDINPDGFPNLHVSEHLVGRGGRQVVPDRC